ncbi:CvpA family protein [Komagataeibacter medellinensis]|uniref:CvpA family protein n=1 Tax=Komagataeibacter medellinensis TaxID=1177712 RepID=A0ABQ6VVB8_9PROT|nr:CvpA family protein [Komagataeibacter medellinensis]KAB8124147.1 CvpA family protein [Komagataeibacter medellinensis]
MPVTCLSAPCGLARMNWIDIAAIAITGLSALVGAVRGFSREILGLAAWIMAFVLAVAWYGALIPYATQWISNHTLAALVSFAVLFLALLVIFTTTAHISGRAVQGSLLSGLDRVLGLLFGLVRGYICLVILYAGITALIPAAQWPDVMRSSRIVPLIGSSVIYLNAVGADKLPAHLAQPTGTRHDAPI